MDTNSTELVKRRGRDEYWFKANVTRTETRIFEEVLSQLVGVADYEDKVKGAFDSLVFRLVKYLGTRMDLGRADFPYLSAFKSGQEPVEKDLQDDLVSYLRSNGQADPERSNVSGGRADIYLPYDGFRIVIECKREFMDWCDEVVSPYVNQTEAYQQTDVRLGVLAVLDLSARPPGVPHLDQCFTVRKVTNEASDIRTVVVMRVPGNRQTPNTASKAKKIAKAKKAAKQIDRSNA